MSGFDSDLAEATSGAGRLGRRLGLGLVDNLLDVASNFPVPFLVAWVGDEAGREFGAVAITLLIYNLSSGLAGSMGVETYTVLGFGEKKDVDSSSGPLLFAIAVGLLASVAAVLTLVVSGIETTASILIALAILPLTYQRQLRLIGHVRNKHLRSAQNSLLWLGVSGSCLLFAYLVTGLTPTSVVVAWLVGGGAAVIHYLVTWPFSRSIRVRRPNKDVSRTAWSLAFEFVVDRGALDVVGLMLSAAFGAVFAGQLRLGQSVFGLSNRLIGAARPTLLAEARRRHSQEDPAVSKRFMTGTSLLLTGIPALTLLVILLIGEGTFERAFGAAGVGAFAFAPWLGLRRIARNAGLGPSMFLRVANQLQLSRRVRVAGGCLTIVTALFLGWGSNPTTTLAGLALVSGVVAALWWTVSLKSLNSVSKEPLHSGI